MTDTSSLSHLIERLEQNNPEACWAWPRKTDAKGRGRVWVAGKLTLAHRAIWEWKVGPIPPGKMLCHHCDNAGCVNPAHMYVGTHSDNMRDMKERRRYWAAREPEKVKALGAKLGASNNWCKGENNATAKLTRAQADEIRSSPESERKLAKQYGVAPSTIHRIKAGEIWT